MSRQVQSQAEIRRLLFKDFEEARLKNPGYSLRAFARRLRLAPSALSEILSGKRPISVRVAEQIAERLAWAPDVRERVVRTYLGSRRKTTPHRRESIALDVDQYHAISEWYHFAILSLAETRGFRSDARWIGCRLGISADIALAAVERLLRMGLLNQEKNGRWAATGKSYATTDGIVNLALRKSHQRNLELAKASLETDPIDRRDFTAMTMVADPAKLPEAKRRIREFRDELSAFLEDGDKSEVFKICLQLFPLTKFAEES